MLNSSVACMQYVVHFPKGERYVSILKEATEPQAQVVLAAERARLKKLIKHQMAETALIADADEGLGQNSDTVSCTSYLHVIFVS